MNFYAICSALLKEEDPTSSVFFEIVKTPEVDELGAPYVNATPIRSTLYSTESMD